MATQYAVQGEHYVAYGLALNGGFTPEDEKSPPANAGVKETKPAPCCAGKIGTGNDSDCPLLKPTFVMFELMVCKGTADDCANAGALKWRYL